MDIAVREEKDQGIHFDFQNCKLDGVSESLDASTGGYEDLLKSRFDVNSKALSY